MNRLKSGSALGIPLGVLSGTIKDNHIKIPNEVIVYIVIPLTSTENPSMKERYPNSKAFVPA
jgi:hypothetical protein